ncbi:hypothetical protein MCC01953_03970 [Bifidobacteriaceae bacterium MCC01953]|nr:hypothetical protein MCC01953_03970 [Bifidobacteriaceae bacterium MCC01953]
MGQNSVLSFLGQMGRFADIYSPFRGQSHRRVGAPRRWNMAQYEGPMPVARPLRCPRKAE